MGGNSRITSSICPGEGLPFGSVVVRDAMIQQHNKTTRPGALHSGHIRAGQEIILYLLRSMSTVVPLEVVPLFVVLGG
jgi:hypothetical protein